MRRIFLDVGANTGQSLAAVLPLRFTQIVCFEPAQICWPFLHKIADHRVRVEPFGLWNKNIQAPVYDPGTKGAGLWVKDKRKLSAPDKPIVTVQGQFRRVSEWFQANLTKPATVYLKLNVEGAECDILDDLLDSGEFAKVSHVMVDFDVNKITGMRHRSIELRSRLDQYPFPRVAYCKDVMKGETHQDRIRNWLRLVDEATDTQA